MHAIIDAVERYLKWRNSLQDVAQMTNPYLLTRLESLTGPDREVDEEIADLLLETSELEVGQIIPHYTRSIDAALTLVPEGVDWWVSHLVGWSYRAGIKFPDLSQFDAEKCATPAIALCIAALKARGVE